MTFEQHLRTVLEVNNALRELYPERKLTKKTEQTTKEKDKLTKR